MTLGWRGCSAVVVVEVAEWLPLMVAVPGPAPVRSHNVFAHS